MTKKKLRSWNYVADVLSIEGCSASSGIVYSYMLAKFTWFKKKGQDYFENQDTIAEALHIPERTVRGCIKFLKESGLIDVYKIKTDSYPKNKYIVHDRFGVYLHIKQEVSDDIEFF